METVEPFQDDQGTLRFHPSLGYKAAGKLVLNAVQSFHSAWRIMTVRLGHDEMELAQLPIAYHAVMTEF